MRVCSSTWQNAIAAGEPYPADKMITCPQCSFAFPSIYFGDDGLCIECGEFARLHHRRRDRDDDRADEDPEFQELVREAQYWDGRNEHLIRQERQAIRRLKAQRSPRRSQAQHRGGPRVAASPRPRVA